MLRIQPPPPPPPSAGRAGGAPGGGRGGGLRRSTFVSMFPPRPSTAFKPNDWNTFEVLVDANVFRASVNAPVGGGLAIDAETGTFGPIALYVGGTGEVRFKNLALKDLQRRVTPAEKTSPRFRAQHFEDFYYGWSAAAGDFNHDGVLDVTMGNRYYLGPDVHRLARVLSRPGVQSREGVRPGDGELRGRLHRRRMGRHPRRRIARARALREPAR